MKWIKKTRNTKWVKKILKCKMNKNAKKKKDFGK